MNFFGIAISLAQFDAGIRAARAYRKAGFGQEALDEAVRKALGFEPGDVAAPPGAGGTTLP